MLFRKLTKKIFCNWALLKTNNDNNPISARQPDLVIDNQTKRTCRIEDFAVSADNRVKLKYQL